MSIELYEVVKKLVGPVHPVGESYEDERRFANLQALTELVDRLMTDIDDIATNNAKRTEYSMRRSGAFCNKFLDHLGIQS